MAWLIGITCVVIIIYLWRVSLSLALFAGIVIGIIAVITQYNNENDALLKEERELALQLKIENSQVSATSENKLWRVGYEIDPASGNKIACSAYISSNDGLCELIVENMLNGTKLTGLYCRDFKIPDYKDIEVKFDNLSTSDKMNLESYKYNEDVYIPSTQSSFSEHLDYNKFIERLKTSNSVAIKISTPDEIWVTFSLKGASDSLNKLGTNQ